MMRKFLTTTVSSLALAAAASGANLVHYWDFDSLTSGAPDDLAGAVPTSNVNGPDISVHPGYGSAYAGAGNSLNTVLTTSGWVRADIHNGTAATAMDFGTGDYAYSYWSFDASNLDGDPRTFG